MNVFVLSVSRLLTTMHVRQSLSLKRLFSYAVCICHLFSRFLVIIENATETFLKYIVTVDLLRTCNDALTVQVATLSPKAMGCSVDQVQIFKCCLEAGQKNYIIQFA